jgi:hypothetical protein
MEGHRMPAPGTGLRAEDPPRTAKRRGILLLVALLVGVASGFAAGFLLWGRAGGAGGSAPESRARKDPPTLLPRRTLADQHTIHVGPDPDRFQPEELDGKLVLRPSELPRVLTFEAGDSDAALDAVERFVSALRPERVRARGPGRVDLEDVDGLSIRWHLEGEAADRTLRVVVIPTDPMSWEDGASRMAQAIGEWAIVNGIRPRSVSSFAAQAAVVTSIRAPRAKVIMGAFDAAKQEFRERGMTLAEDEVGMGLVVEVVRDAKGEVLWSFFWTEDQQRGVFGVRHHADPFDTAGEQEMLLAIFRRAFGRDVQILGSGFSAGR